jgi:hypothetical protein
MDSKTFYLEWIWIRNLVISHKYSWLFSAMFVWYFLLFPIDISDKICYTIFVRGSNHNE